MVLDCLWVGVHKHVQGGRHRVHATAFTSGSRRSWPNSLDLRLKFWLTLTLEA